MGLLDSTQDSTDAILSVMASQPLEAEKPKPKHSAWSVVPRGVAAGAVEVAGNVMDTLGAAGQVVAASGGITPGFDPDAARRAPESARMAEKLKSDGIDWRTDEGQAAYNVARDLRPDPISAGKAEQVVFGLTKGLTKAVGAGAVLGPVAGAVAFGASEGMTASEDLAREGVDLATRTKVGAVTAGLNTVGMALPVAGNTVAKTIMLGAAGGPASFIAQQIATRSILENADYGALAQQYNPLDPVGLALATLLPASFGAIAMRGARTSRAAAPDAVASKPGEVMPAAQETAAVATPEHIDAAMVHNLTIARDIHDSSPNPFSEAAASTESAPPLKTSTAPEITTAARSQPDQMQKLSEPTAKDPHIASILDRAEAIKTEAPDMPVALREDGTHATFSDEIAAIRRQAREGTDTEFGTQDAPLLKVAAECFLSLGA